MTAASCPPTSGRSLLDATRTAKPFRGLSGDDRVALHHGLLHRTAGFRAGEPDARGPSTWRALPSESRPPTRRITSVAVQPLRPDLGRIPRDFPRRSSRPSNPSGREPGPRSPPRCSRRDLKAAGVELCRRGWHVPRLPRTPPSVWHGVADGQRPVKVMQELMRHSTITLTMDRYSPRRLARRCRRGRYAPADRQQPDLIRGRGEPGDRHRRWTHRNPVALHLPYSQDAGGPSLSLAVIAQGRERPGYDFT